MRLRRPLARVAVRIGVLAALGNAAAAGTDGTVLEALRCGVETSRSPSGTTTPGETLGEQRTLVTLVNFTHDPSQPFTTAEIHEALLDEKNPKSTASYVREVSYGQAWLTGTVQGWFSASYDDTACDVWRPSDTQQLIDELDPLLDFSQVDRWIVVSPQNPSCGFNGISTSGKQTYLAEGGTVEMSRIVLNGASLHPNYVAAHELGHSFDAVQHASDYECGDLVVADECSVTDLGLLTDRFDVMGHAWFGAHYSPPNKEQLGWVTSGFIDVTPPGGTFSLRPYETPTGLKALRIPVTWVIDDLHGTTTYYVSYRTPTGFDDAVPELSTPGAMIHMDGRRFRGGTYGRSRLLDTTPHLDPSAGDQNSDSSFVVLEPGNTFNDVEHGVSISTISASPGSLEVSVTISQYCGNGVTDPAIGEACDAGDLAGGSCSSLGFMDGILSCDASCGYDVSLCGMARCGPGHTFGPGETCTANLVSDETDLSLWRSRPTWTEARESPFATNDFDETYIFFTNLQRVDGWSWIYRASLPFDTSSIPDDHVILGADVTLKVLSGFEFGNTHPDLADQLVLVKTTLANSPAAILDDFDQFGSLDNPVEGAPRVDVSDAVVPGSDTTFELNPEGLSWIDREGWTTLGIRGGYDVDDVSVPGEETDLRLYFRASDSPLYGPRLSASYEALGLPGSGAAGAVPDGSGVAGVPLTIEKPSQAQARLLWDASCAPGDADFAIYEGTLGDFMSHQPIACTTNGELSAPIDPGAADSYYLVVPRTADREGSYGTGTTQARPPSSTPCVPQAVATCD